jgi:predicted NACHT family NTPase
LKRDYPLQNFINLIQSNSNLLTENQGVYEFSHLSFQEYLAGMQLKNANEESLILEKLANPFWRETIIFYGVQTDITNLSKQALENPSIASLSLVYQCLEEGLISDQNVAQQLEECLINSLESSDPELFDLAAKVYFSRRLNYLRNQNQKK